MKKIFGLMLSLLLIAPVTFAQDAVTDHSDNKFYAIQHALNLMNQGWDGNPSEPMNSVAATALGRDVAQVYHAELMISEYVNNIFGFESSSQYSQLSARNDPLSTIEKLRSIEEELIPDLEDAFDKMVTDFFASPTQENFLKFTASVHLLKTQVIQRLLEMHFTVDQSSEMDAKEILSLKPLYQFLFQAATLVDMVGNQPVSIIESNTAVRTQFNDAKKIYEQEVGPRLDIHMNKLQVMAILLIDQNKKLTTGRASDEVIQHTIESFDEALYLGFVAAVEKLQLTPQQQMLVLRNMSFIDLSDKLPGSMQLATKSELEFSRRGYGFLRSILKYKFGKVTYKGQDLDSWLLAHTNMVNVILVRRIPQNTHMARGYEKVLTFTEGQKGPEQRAAISVAERVTLSLRAVSTR